MKIKNLNNKNNVYKGQDKQPNKRRYFFKIITVFASVFLTLAITELFLRAADISRLWDPNIAVRSKNWSDELHHASNYPDLAYELRPDFETMAFGKKVSTNNFGMRSGKIKEAKDPGTKRILVLGDSFTFGWAIEQEDAYPALLENKLNTGGKVRYEVLNMAVCGYSTQDEITLFMHKGARFDPDFVVIGYTLNDPDIYPMQPIQAHYQKPALWKRFALLRQARTLWWRLDMMRYGGNSYAQYLHQKPETWLSVINSFQKLKIWADANNKKVIVIIFPDVTSPDWPKYDKLMIHKQVGDTASSLDFIVLDMYTEYSKWPKHVLTVTDKDYHPSVFGHKLVAKSLEEIIIKN